MTAPVIPLDGSYVQAAHLDADPAYSICWTHHAAEPRIGCYDWCVECGHVFMKSGDLRRDDRRMRKGLGVPFLARWLDRTPVTSCPHCAHDL